jgi:hypothetical protein
VAKFAAGVVDIGGKLIPVEILPPVSLIQVVHLDLLISLQVFKKFETVLLVYSGAEEKLIHEKNQKQKIS